MMLKSLFIYTAIYASCTFAKGQSENAINWGSLHCPHDNVTTLPTPTYGSKERVWMICTELVIDAPIRTVYDALLDFNAYHLWNSFVVDVQVASDVTDTPEDVYVGMQMFFTVAGLIPGANTTSDEIVTVLDDDIDGGYLLNAWRSNVLFNGTLMRAEHPNILTVAGHRKTRYVSYETYYEGLATPLILPLKPQLQAEFDQQGLDLKAYVEKV